MGEQIYRCEKCKKVYAISESVVRKKCPEDNSVLEAIGLSVDDWKFMSEADKEKIRLFGYTQIDNNEAKKKYPKQNVALIFIFAALLVAILIVGSIFLIKVSNIDRFVAGEWVAIDKDVYKLVEQYTQYCVEGDMKGLSEMGLPINQYDLVAGPVIADYLYRIDIEGCYGLLNPSTDIIDIRIYTQEYYEGVSEPDRVKTDLYMKNKQEFIDSESLSEEETEYYDSISKLPEMLELDGKWHTEDSVERQKILHEINKRIGDSIKIDENADTDEDEGSEAVIDKKGEDSKDTHGTVVKQTEEDAGEEMDWIPFETVKNASFLIPSSFDNISPERTAAGYCYIFEDPKSEITIEASEVSEYETPSGSVVSAIRDDYEYYRGKMDVEDYYKYPDKEFYLKGFLGDYNAFYKEIAWDGNLFMVTIQYPVDEDKEKYYSDIASKFIKNYKITGYDEAVKIKVYSYDRLIEVSDYYNNYISLVDSLNMQKCESWQMSEDSYAFNDFYLEYSEEFGIFSMKNEADNGIILYGISVGDNINDAIVSFENNGWETLYDSDERAAFMYGDREYYSEIFHDSNGVIIDWYVCNWYEGE